MPFLVEGRDVILVDDVLFTGRTIRAGLDALLAHGRPETVKLLVLVDRRFQRELPIEPQFIGKSLTASTGSMFKLNGANKATPAV